MSPRLEYKEFLNYKSLAAITIKLKIGSLMPPEASSQYLMVLVAFSLKSYFTWGWYGFDWMGSPGTASPLYISVPAALSGLATVVELAAASYASVV